MVSANRVLILGGCGRIGSAVAQDLLTYTDAAITVTGRSPQPSSKPRVTGLTLSLDDQAGVDSAIAAHNLVIHCAGPFSYRDHHILDSCIAQQVNYLDVADNPNYVKQALARCDRAQAAGITAVVSTGVFPGISNSMVRQGIEQFDQANSVQLNYVVAGSGGAGVTVMRTTFLELLHPIQAKIEGEMQAIAPYSQREVVTFPSPYGRCGVYWFNTIEAMTLADSFPLQTIITKFGSVPDIYNHLTWLMAHGVPKKWLAKPETIEFLAETSYWMTTLSDRFSGVGLAMQADIHGSRAGQSARFISNMVYPDTAAAAGYGTGSLAQLLLSGQWQQPGVWPVERSLPTDLFEKAMAQRGLEIQQSFIESYPFSVTLRRDKAE
ncbi:MAG: saccharopine dehydrogenase NADP-binding domain-containing protein [Cyanobacteria bacterium P01_C01_bin.73]